MKLLLICIYTIFTPMHVKHVAEYTYSYDGVSLSLKFEMEKAELLEFNLNNCDVHGMTALCTFQYLNENTSIKINGKEINLELQSSKTLNDHLVVYFSTPLTVDSIEEIEISNNCFYEFEKRFMNRIIVDIERFQKSFLFVNNKKNKIHLK